MTAAVLAFFKEVNHKPLAGETIFFFKPETGLCTPPAIPGCLPALALGVLRRHQGPFSLEIAFWQRRAHSAPVLALRRASLSPAPDPIQETHATAKPPHLPRAATPVTTPASPGHGSPRCSTRPPLAEEESRDRRCPRRPKPLRCVPSLAAHQLPAVLGCRQSPSERGCDCPGCRPRVCKPIHASQGCTLANILSVCVSG